MRSIARHKLPLSSSILMASACPQRLTFALQRQHSRLHPRYIVEPPCLVVWLNLFPQRSRAIGFLLRLEMIRPVVLEPCSSVDPTDSGAEQGLVETSSLLLDRNMTYGITQSSVQHAPATNVRLVLAVYAMPNNNLPLGSFAPKAVGVTVMLLPPGHQFVLCRIFNVCACRHGLSSSPLDEFSYDSRKGLQRSGGGWSRLSVFGLGSQCSLFDRYTALDHSLVQPA